MQNVFENLIGKKLPPLRDYSRLLSRLTYYSCIFLLITENILKFFIHDRYWNII